MDWTRLEFADSVTMQRRASPYLQSSPELARGVTLRALQPSKQATSICKLSVASSDGRA